ncbi:hypothetical protein M569_13387, partial [Genlisea aurea]
MNCFNGFKVRGRFRSVVRKSAPVAAKKACRSDLEEDGRATKSTGSASTPPRTIPEIYRERAQNLRVFTYDELSRATSNFSRLLKIGEGGFGCVYKGSIEEKNQQPVVVAIKKLNVNGHQGHKQWVSEVQFLGVVEHPNLVKLIGYCAVDGERGIQRLLVYEYMQNKSLEDHLFNNAYPVLSWDQRLQIMLGAAQGLAYLHEELEIQVIYRDFKSSNVLLDKDFTPKLSDFGLAREGPTEDRTHVSTTIQTFVDVFILHTQVVGTYGYAAPDYVQTGHLTSKSDVWSFGVVLYEILTGRRSLERHRPGQQQKLLDWVKQYPSGSKKFHTIIDPRLENQYSIPAARKISKLADSCLVKSPKGRPKMSQVVESIKQIVEEIAEHRGADDDDDDEDDDDGVEEEKKGSKKSGVSESARRRMAHLASLSKNVESSGGFRRVLMMQRS